MPASVSCICRVQKEYSAAEQREVMERMRSSRCPDRRVVVARRPSQQHRDGRHRVHGGGGVGDRDKYSAGIPTARTPHSSNIHNALLELASSVQNYRSAYEVASFDEKTAADHLSTDYHSLLQAISNPASSYHTAEPRPEPIPVTNYRSLIQGMTEDMLGSSQWMKTENIQKSRPIKRKTDWDDNEIFASRKNDNIVSYHENLADYAYTDAVDLVYDDFCGTGYTEDTNCDFLSYDEKVYQEPSPENNISIDLFNQVENLVTTESYRSVHSRLGGEAYANEYQNREYQSRPIRNPLQPLRRNRNVAPYQKPAKGVTSSQVIESYSTRKKPIPLMSIGCALDELKFLRHTPKKLPYRQRYTLNDLQRLFRKAQKFNVDNMNICRHFYRDKDRDYYDNILNNCNGVMERKLKDLHGDPRNPINGRLRGLFFNVRSRTNSKPVAKSFFGERRLMIPIENLLEKEHRLYFADFYCTHQAHYVTMVLTRPDTSSDNFCQKYLLNVDKEHNNFFRVTRSEVDGSLTVQSPFRPIVEIFLIDDVNITTELLHGATFSDVEQVGGRQAGDTGYGKKRHCDICNL